VTFIDWVILQTLLTVQAHYNAASSALGAEVNSASNGQLAPRREDNENVQRAAAGSYR
jgi:hypothetical protein